MAQDRVLHRRYPVASTLTLTYPAACARPAAAASGPGPLWAAAFKVPS